MNHDVMSERNRAINYLRQPHLTKSIGRLARADGSRDLWGHLCEAIGLRPVDVFGELSFLGNYAVPPHSVLEHFQFNPNYVDVLTKLNDDKNVTLSQIADYLEANISGAERTMPFKQIL